MKTWLKLVPVFSIVLLLAVTSGTAFAAPRNASLSGNGYNGTDPQKTGCSTGATTLLGAYIKNGSTTIGLVELRWSPTCKTNWTRVTSYIGTTGLAGEIERESGADGGYLCYNNPATPGCLGSDVFNQTTQMWTPQVYALHNNARAKGWITQGGNTYYNCVANPGWSC